MLNHKYLNKNHKYSLTLNKNEVSFTAEAHGLEILQLFYEAHLRLTQYALQ